MDILNRQLIDSIFLVVQNAIICYRVTMGLNDIAEELGISVSAVSLALSGKAGVSQETRLKVLARAKELGYVPRSLVDAKDLYKNADYLRFVACVGSDEIVSKNFHELPFFTDLIHHIGKYARDAKYSLVISTIPNDSFLEELKRTERMHPSKGILLLATNLHEEIVTEAASMFPNIVAIDTLFERRSIDFVVMNNTHGAYFAGKYLRELGHTRIGYLESTARIPNFEIRRKAFEEAIKETGIDPQEIVRFSVTPSIDGTRKDLAGALTSRKGIMPTALFCENDYMAIGAIKACNDLNISVPDDISIMGFDDIPQARVVTPELTTMRVDREQLAYLSVQRLIERIEKRLGRTPMICILDTELVERDSVKKIG